MNKVTCLCPTYGRFSLMQESLTYFVNQSYSNCELIILNDAPEPFQCDVDNVTVVNAGERYETLGHKRQALLEMAESKYVAQWDDDDVYLPWHLEQAVENLSEGKMVKPKEAFYLRGSVDKGWEWKGTTSNWLEAMTVFDRQKAMDLGGYTEKVSGQGIRMIKRFKEEGSYTEYTPKPAPSFVFRFGEGTHFHIQGGDKRSHKRFGEVNKDFGDGKLKTADVSRYVDVLLEYAKPYVSDWATFKQAVHSLS